MSADDPPVTRPVGGRHRREESHPTAQTPVGTGGGARRAATRVLLVLCLPAAVAALVFWLVTPAKPAPPSLLSASSQSAVTAAKSSVHLILSYDYRSISAEIAQAKAQTTGLFAQQYARSAAQLLSQAQQNKAIVQATIRSNGVVSATSSNVVVLLFVDQASVRQTPGQKTPTTRIDQSRVRVTMTRVNGNWLVSALAAL